MHLFRRVVGGVSPRYLARAYLISFALYGVVLWVALSAPPGTGHPAPPQDPNYGALAICFVNALLFPFAKLVWDELRDLLLGHNFILMNAVIWLFFKLLINALLWSFAIVLAPLGLGYLWFRTRETAVPN